MDSLVALAVLSLNLAPPAAPSPQAQDLVVVRSAGLDALVADRRDTRLRAVLAHVDERLAELPDDFDGRFELPRDALPLLARVLASPMSLRIGMDPDAPDFPFFAELRCERASEAAAGEMVAVAAGVLAELGMPPAEPDGEGVRAVPAPAPATLAARGAELVLTVGAPPAAPPALWPTHLPDGMAPALVAQADLGALLELLAMNPYAEPFVANARALGLGDAKASWALGFGELQGISTFTLGGCAEALQKWGLVAEEGLTPANLRPVPLDARWASVSRVDLHAAWRGLRELLTALGADTEEFDGALESFAAETGVDLERGLLAPLGSLVGMYASDSTGGGGMLSTVLFVAVDDADTLEASLRRIEARLNSFAREEASGYMQVRRRATGDVELAMLTFPGLPVPFEPAWALAHGFLVVGATPQAVEVALAQIAGGRPDLGASPRLLEALGPGWEGALSLSYVDTAHFLGEGYGLASLGASALANAVRSRADDARRVGPALAPYAVLAEDPRAYGSTTRVVDGALVVETRFDRSWSVNGTAMAGLLGSLMGTGPMLAVGPGLLATLVVPRVVQAVAAATTTQAKADIWAITRACEEFAMRNGGEYPDELEWLVTPDENGYSFLHRREALVDPWGRPYRYETPSEDQQRPRIYTLGRDGEPGGGGEDRDIDNWMIEDGEF